MKTYKELRDEIKAKMEEGGRRTLEERSTMGSCMLRPGRMNRS